MKSESTPWQLRMFSKTLKKQQRLRQLRDLLGQPGQHERCLLVTCGDNNGAMNWHLRALGGHWLFSKVQVILAYRNNHINNK